MPDFPVYDKCNNRCLMCSNRPGLWRDTDFGLETLLKRVDNFFKGEDEFLNNYADAFSLTGGEPTLHPRIFEIIRGIRSRAPGMTIRCLTNGRMFVYPGFTEAFLAASPRLELILSLHGPTAAVHDTVTRVPGSFEQTCRGISHILKFRRPGQRLALRVVIHRLNHTHLMATTRFIRRRFPDADRLVFIFFEIEGHAGRNYRRLRLTYRQLAPHIVKVGPLIRFFREVRFYHFPLCTLPESFYPHVWRTLPRQEVAFVPACRRCPLKRLCLGIHKEYLRFAGNTEFKPVVKKLRLKEGPSWHRPILKVLPEERP